jgi:hypothetical protein
MYISVGQLLKLRIDWCCPIVTFQESFQFPPISLSSFKAYENVQYLHLMYLLYYHKRAKNYINSNIL